MKAPFVLEKSYRKCMGKRPSPERLAWPSRWIGIFVLVIALIGYSSEARPSARPGVASVSTQQQQQIHLQSNFLTKVSKALVRGGTSRAIAQAILYPVDALRTLAQTRDGRTLADVGAGALLRGCLTTSSFALGTGAIQFGVVGAAKETCGTLVASAIGAAASCLVSVPQEVIKQRLVTGVYVSFRQAVASIYKTDGVRGFYSAWWPTVSRNVPFVIITFTSQDWIQDQLRRMHKKEDGLNLLENTSVGMASALVAGVVTNPTDVIKTRMMTQAASNAEPYKSALDCAVTIFRNEGARKFYAGFAQRSVYMCGLWGITFALNGHFQKRENILVSQTTTSARGST